MRKLLNNNKRRDIEVMSAGTSAVYGLKPTRETVEVMKEEGIDVSEYFSKPLTKELIDKSDLIFVMSETHRNKIIDISASASDKVRIISENGIQDPIGSNMDVYRACVKDIKKSLHGIMEELRHEQ